jgi:hypothetical protein
MFKKHVQKESFLIPLAAGITNATLYGLLRSLKWNPFLCCIIPAIAFATVLTGLNLRYRGELFGNSLKEED